MMNASDLQSRIKRINLGGVSTRYYDDGRPGDPIFLIHGCHFGFFVPLGIESWGDVLDELGECGRVVAYDKLGMGETDLPLTAADWTIDAVVDHAIRLIEALNLRRVTVMGHSRGGLAALMVAFRIPERIKKLVVISSASAAPAVATGSDMDFYDNVERTAPLDAAGIVRHYHAAQAVAEGELPPAYVETAARWLNSANQKAAVTGYARNAAEHWLPSLARAKVDVQAQLRTDGIPVPTLLIWGANDRSAPIALGYALFELIAHATDNASMIVLNKAGHQIFRDQKEHFKRTVASFITA